MLAFIPSHILKRPRCSTQLLTFLSVVLNPGCLLLLPEELSQYSGWISYSDQLNLNLGAHALTVLNLS